MRRFRWQLRPARAEACRVRRSSPLREATEACDARQKGIDHKELATRKPKLQAPRLTASESVTLRLAAYGKSVTVAGVEVTVMMQNFAQNKTRVRVDVPSPQLLALSGSQQHPENVDGYYFYDL